MANSKNVKSSRKIKKEELIYNDCWMYILLLTTLVILCESLKSYTIKIFGVYLTFSLFLLPLIYFLANYITKKYDYKKTVAAIAISGVILVCFPMIMAFALGKSMSLSNLSGEFCAYVVSQFINLTIYLFLLNNTKSPKILIYLNYLFSLVIYYMFYTLIYLNMIILDNFWKGYLITIIIQAFLVIPITIIDKKIKRGQQKIK